MDMDPKLITDLIIFSISFVIILFIVMYFTYQEEGEFDSQQIVFFGIIMNVVCCIIIVGLKLFLIPIILIFAFIWLLIKLFQFIIVKLDMIGGKRDGW